LFNEYENKKFYRKKNLDGIIKGAKKHHFLSLKSRPNRALNVVTRSKVIGKT
jgi:hypothetical protein